MAEIIPAILSNDFSEIQEMIAKAEGAVSRVQIDVVDGRFFANKTLDPSFLSGLDTTLDLDFHLMTKEPVDWVEKAAGGGADRIIAQVEMMTNQVEFVGKVSEIGLSVGLALDLESRISALDSAILTNLDVVLVMSVRAGMGGQDFDERAIDKIKELDLIRKKDTTPFRICVDGGINEKNIRSCTDAGADEIAIGRRIFDGDFVRNLAKLREVIDK